MCVQHLNKKIRGYIVKKIKVLLFFKKGLIANNENNKNIVVPVCSIHQLLQKTVLLIDSIPLLFIVLLKIRCSASCNRFVLVVVVDAVNRLFTNMYVNRIFTIFYYIP